ncbi:MAG TPA: TetR/AcrR family transcriptional regulator [Candidatus Binatia bacterium]|nr:TetR/AcrR family transcriptional regulator [Candidatus Binatia bacterium]
MGNPESGDAVEAREKILETAARLFAEHGYENTSISQVARAAQVSKALIFWYFDTKEKLYRSALRKTLEPYIIAIDDLDGRDEQGQIERLIELFAEFVNENVYSVRFFLSMVLQGEHQPDDVIRRVSELYRVFRNLIADIIAGGQSRGVFGQHCNPQLDAAMIMAALDGVLVQNFLSTEFVHDAGEMIAHLKASLLPRLLRADH